LNDKYAQDINLNRALDSQVSLCICAASVICPSVQCQQPSLKSSSQERSNERANSFGAKKENLVNFNYKILAYMYQCLTWIILLTRRYKFIQIKTL